MTEPVVKLEITSAPGLSSLIPSKLLTGKPLYCGDFCNICDKEILEEDLEDGNASIDVVRGQHGHLVLNASHKKCYIFRSLSVDVALGVGNGYSTDELNYMKHFIDLALARA